jgi:hypothetical protein
VFRVVDTGDAFKGKGLTRMTSALRTRRRPRIRKVNGLLHLGFAIPLPPTTSRGQ